MSRVEIAPVADRIQMAPSFKKVGHACLIVSFEGHSILLDPWFGTPVNYGVFHAFPAPSVPTEKEINELSAIHISHIHDDHCDLTTLRALPKHLPVLIGKFKNKEFYHRVVGLGFSNVIEIDPGARFQIGSLELSIFPKLPFDGTFDSSVVLTAAGKNYYIANDCLHRESVYWQLAQTYGGFEGAFLGYSVLSSAMWCSDFSLCRDFLERSDSSSLLETRQDTLRYHVQLVCKELKWVVLYASEFRFLNSDLQHHNDLFAPYSDILTLNLGDAKPVLLNPGHVFSELSEAEISDFNQNYREPVISQKDLLPSWVDENCPSVDVESIKKRAFEYFSAVIHRQTRNWVAPFLIQIRLIDQKSHETIQFYFDGDTLVASEVADGEPDFLIEYPARAIGALLEGRWTLPAFHNLYLHRAFIVNVKFGQMGLWQWS